MSEKHSLAEKFPYLGRGRIGAHTICDPNYFEAERDKVFRKSWLRVGAMADLKRPGSYFAKDIPTLDESVIVTRDRQGDIRAFRNFCTHRGMKLCKVGTHTGNRMNCPFHGWAFSLDGNLAGLEGEEYFYNFDKAELALHSVRCEVWEDNIFINLDPDPKESLKDFIAELRDGFTGYFSPENWEKVGHYRWQLDFNWKLYLDSSVEGYHAAYVHLFNNTGQIASENPAPLWLPEDWIRLYKRHRIVGIPTNVGDRQLSPAEAFSLKFGNVTAYAKDASNKLPPNVNIANADNHAFDILEIFPNQVMFNSANMMAVIQLWPESEKSTHCEVEVFLPHAKNWSEKLAQIYGRISLRDVVREDMNTAAGIQNVTKASDEFVLCDQEIAVRHSYFTVDQAVNSPD